MTRCDVRQVCSSLHFHSFKDSAENLPLLVLALFPFMKSNEEVMFPWPIILNIRTEYSQWCKHLSYELLSVCHLAQVLYTDL